MGVGEDVGGADLIWGRHPEERPEHSGVALDCPGRARATPLLDEERVDRLLPGGGLAGLEGGEREGRHGWVSWRRMDPIHHSGGPRKQHDAGIVTDLAE